MPTRIIALLGLLAVAAAARPAAAQNSTWANNPAFPNWTDANAWTNGTVPTGTATFLSAGAAVNPIVSGTVTATRLDLTNNGTTFDYDILSGGAGSVLALTSTASAQGSAALDVRGGGVTAIEPGVTLGTTGYVYVTGVGTVLDLAGPLTGNNVFLRVDGNATLASANTIRLRGANAITGPVNFGGITGGAADGRYEFGADNALGTSGLALGGSSQRAAFIPFDPAGAGGVTRTLGNSTLTLAGGANNPVLTFGDPLDTTQANRNNSNSLVFPTTAVQLRGDGNRQYNLRITSTAGTGLSPVVSTSSVQFGGTVALRVNADATSAAGTIQFVQRGRADFTGQVVNGGATGAGTSGITVGTGGGNTTVRLTNTGNSYRGPTNLQSGGLIVGGNAPATGAGALGNPDPGQETVTVGTATGLTDRYLLLDVAAGSVTLGRPVLITTGPAAPPVTLLGTIGAGGNTGTYAGAITVGTAVSPNPARLILNANSPIGVAQFNGPLQRNTGYTGAVTIQANSTLGGYGGAGVVAVGGGAGQTAGLNAQTGVVGGTFRVDAGTTFDSGRGFYVGGGTAVVNGGLAAGTGPLVVGAGFSLDTPDTITATGAGALAGTGTVNQPVTVNTGAALAPGAGSAGGVLTGNAAVAFNAGSVFRLAVTGGTTPATGDVNTGTSSGTTPGAANTRLVAGGNSIALTSPDVVVDLAGVTLTEFANYSFVVATGTGITPAGTGTPTQVNVGQFTFTNSPLLITNPSLFVSADSTQVFLNFTPVPEPATVLAVAAAGLGGLRLVRRRPATA